MKGTDKRTTKIGDIEIERLSADQSTWYTVQQQSFTIDKEAFILEQFSKDFPTMKIKDFDQLKNVLSRSRKLQEWYATSSLLYADSIQLPVAFKDIFEPARYQEAFKDMMEYKSFLAKESEDISILAKKFDDDLASIKEKYKKELQRVVSKDKIYPILTLRSDDMPITIQIEIENFTPKTSDTVQQKTIYARELLICYQRALLQKVKDDPEIDIIALIEAQKVK